MVQVRDVGKEQVPDEAPILVEDIVGLAHPGRDQDVDRRHSPGLVGEEGRPEHQENLLPAAEAAKAADSAALVLRGLVDEKKAAGARRAFLSDSGGFE